METSTDITEFYTRCDGDQILLFKKVLTAFDAASFGFDALDVYCPEVFHGIWLSFKNAIASKEKNDLTLFLDVIENIKKLEQSLRRLVWINTLEFFTLFKVDFINQKKNIDLVVKMHPNAQRAVYKFFEWLNRQDSEFYNLRQYDYLIYI